MSCKAPFNKTKREKETPGYPALLIFMCCKVQLWRVKCKEIAVRLVVTKTTFSKAVAVYWEVDGLTMCQLSSC